MGLIINTGQARCRPGPTGWVCCLARPPAVGLPAQSLPGHRLPQNYVHHRETASTEFYEGKEGPNRPLWLWSNLSRKLPIRKLTCWAECGPKLACVCHDCLKLSCPGRDGHELPPPVATPGIMRINRQKPALGHLNTVGLVWQHLPSEKHTQTQFQYEHNQSSLGNSAFMLLETFSPFELLNQWMCTCPQLLVYNVPSVPLMTKWQVAPCTLCAQVAHIRSFFSLPLDACIFFLTDIALENTAHSRTQEAKCMAPVTQQEKQRAVNSLSHLPEGN